MGAVRIEKDKFMEALKRHCESGLDKCIDCPYNAHDTTSMLGEIRCRERLIHNAWKLLKAQPEENEEETRTRHDIRLMLRDHVMGFCPECKEICIKAVNPRFCGYCGQAVKWND